MISGMILLVVATGIVASAIAGMLNDRRRLPAAPASRFPTTGSSPALQALAGRNVQPGCAADPQALGGGIDTGEDLSFDDICCSSRR
jgi:hypothetical protein